MIESKTCHEARNDAVSLGRIHRFFIQGHTVKHEQLPKGTGEMYVYLQLGAQLLPNSLHLDTAGDDCPVFDGLFDYCAISAGGSMGARLPDDSERDCAD
jgi:hypothetical protein